MPPKLSLTSSHLYCKTSDINRLQFSCYLAVSIHAPVRERELEHSLQGVSASNKKKRIHGKFRRHQIYNSIDEFFLFVYILYINKYIYLFI